MNPTKDLRVWMRTTVSQRVGEVWDIFAVVYDF